MKATYERQLAVYQKKALELCCCFHLKVLHGEQYTELLCEKFPTNGVLTSTFKIQAILDKGSGALYVLDVTSHLKDTNEPVVRNQLSIFVVGSGGFNGPRNSPLVVETKKKPARNPDCSTLYKTSVDQVRLHKMFYLMFSLVPDTK